MSLMALLNVSLAFQGKEIFNKIGFQVDREDRIGLVGRNGSGKTSLLRLIAGVLVPDVGREEFEKSPRGKNSRRALRAEGAEVRATPCGGDLMILLCRRRKRGAGPTHRKLNADMGVTMMLFIAPPPRTTHLEG